MNRFLVPLGAFVLLAVVLAIGLKHSPEKGVIKSPLLGKPAPTFSLPVLTDTSRTFHSADLKGRWYLFNVWGTWCVECRHEHETLLEIKKRGEVSIVGLDWRDEDTAALQWLQELGNPYEVIAADREGRIAIDWGVYAAPETFLVDPHGTVVYKYIGPLTMDAWLAEFVPRLPPKQAAKL